TGSSGDQTGGGSAGVSATGGMTSGGGAGKGGSGTGGTAGGGAGKLDHVFVIELENHDEGSIIGNSNDAPYLNGLLMKGSSASAFKDELPLKTPSEPHYVWLESGTNTFADHTFTTDDDASTANSTIDTQHLATQLETAKISWISYQEGINDATGACPIASDGY